MLILPKQPHYYQHYNTVVRDVVIQLLFAGIAVLILAFLRSQFILQTSILRTIELSMFLTELMYVLISFNC